jgi:hypothetical protein
MTNVHVATAVNEERIKETKTTNILLTSKQFASSRKLTKDEVRAKGRALRNAKEFRPTIRKTTVQLKNIPDSFAAHLTEMLESYAERALWMGEVIGQLHAEHQKKFMENMNIMEKALKTMRSVTWEAQHKEIPIQRLGAFGYAQIDFEKSFTAINKQWERLDIPEEDRQKILAIASMNKQSRELAKHPEQKCVIAKQSGMRSDKLGILAGCSICLKLDACPKKKLATKLQI